jgi:hypothetical protein
LFPGDRIVLYIQSSFILFALAAPAVAADHVGIAAFAPEMYRISALSGASQLVGTHTLVAPEEIRIGALARGLDEKLYAISDSQGESRVYRFDEQTGAATPQVVIATGPVSPGGASFDPTSGLLYWTNTFGFVPWPQLYRMDLATGNVQFLGNIGPVIQNWQIGPAFDPQGALYTVNGDTKTLMKLDKDDPLNGSAAVGPLGVTIDLLNGTALFWDRDLQSLVLYEGLTGRLFAVNRNTGAATPISGVSGIAPLMVDIEGGPCGGVILEYGNGCVGSGGFVPHFGIEGCAIPGGSLTLAVTNALGGSTALLFVGTAQASFPLGGGCSLLVAPVFPPFAALPLSGSGPGNGSIQFGATVPAAASSLGITTQVIVIDAGNPIGGAASNGVFLGIP